MQTKVTIIFDEFTTLKEIKHALDGCATHSGVVDIAIEENK